MIRFHLRVKVTKGGEEICRIIRMRSSKIFFADLEKNVSRRNGSLRNTAAIKHTGASMTGYGAHATVW
jgi:hypothetical protein